MPADALHIRVRLSLQQFWLDVDQILPLGGITAVFGPSGAGKSTLLRVIAGFESAAGRVALGEETWLDSERRVRIPPHRRAVGYMFQEARLFAHLTVAGNLRYAARRAPADERSHKFEEVVAAFDLRPLMQRRIAALSGGERQRVALARTLLASPRLLLLDEPLAALDTVRKAEILPYLESLWSRFAVPTIYVSHAVEEVARLADHTLVLAAGRVHVCGLTTEVLQRLDVQALTGRFEAGVVVAAEVTGHDARYHLSSVDIGGQSITMPMVAHLAPGTPIRLRIRARDVALATTRPQHLSIRNVLSGVLTDIVAEPDSAFAEAFVEVGRAQIRARITRAAVAALSLAAGQSVFVLIKSVTFDRRAL